MSSATIQVAPGTALATDRLSGVPNFHRALATVASDSACTRRGAIRVSVAAVGIFWSGNGTSASNHVQQTMHTCQHNFCEVLEKRRAINIQTSLQMAIAVSHHLVITCDQVMIGCYCRYGRLSPGLCEPAATYQLDDRGLRNRRA